MTGVAQRAAAACLLGVVLVGCGPSEPSIALQAFAAGRGYTTGFAVAENPLSDGGTWLNGKAAGLDWADVATAPGLAHGTQNGARGYDDSTALLTGTWTPDQMARATVRCANPRDDVYEEVALRLRSSLAAHVAIGYEFDFRCTKSGAAYAEIVRWNGPLGKFTYLTRGKGSKYGVASGDTIAATAVGEVLTAYINGVPMLQARDQTFLSGNPGIGFFLQGAGAPGNYGLTAFSAANAPR